MNKRTRLLLKENNELEKTLSDETISVLTDIVVYIRHASISEYNQELVRRDITQMLIDGQTRGLSAAEVVGGDYRAFCDAVIEEMPKLSMKQRVLTSIRDILPAICALSCIWLIFGLVRQLAGGEDWTHIPLTVSELITGAGFIALAVLVVVYITKNSFSVRSKPLIAALLALIIFAAAAYLLIPNSATAVLMRPHLAAALAVTALLYIVYRLLDNLLD